MAALTFAEKIIEHIGTTGCDDVLGKPFFAGRWDEALAKRTDWREFLLAQIGAALIQNPVAVGGIFPVAVPKTRYTFRTVACMSLVDTLKYTALVFSIGDRIERNRLPNNVVFSNRYDPRKCLLDRSNYDKFRQQSKALSESGKYGVKIITDIANYYDRINLHKLENLLKTDIGCDPIIVSKINNVLTLWSHHNSFGLPVGSDASRLLAEAMLINVDRELAHHKIKFIRYVDDYRIFCKSHHRAYEAMQLLDGSLRREGLFLNSGKTKLVDLSKEAEEHVVAKEEFDPIDVDEKVEGQVVIRTRYASRIAKFYKYPGQEAVKKLRQIDLEAMLAEISDPNASEDRLKEYVKACIYADKPAFIFLSRVLDIYPHLIPYIVDAIIKENNRNSGALGREFRRHAIMKFRKIFRDYVRNDYFRIQACRLLCEIDQGAGAFLSTELAKLGASSDMVFSQTLYFLNRRMPRAAFLDLVTSYFSYGPLSRAAIAFLLANGLVIDRDEQRAQMKNVGAVEIDPFLRKLLRP